MPQYSKGAALVIKTLKSLEDAQQYIRTALALLAIMDLSPVESMLAHALCSDSVWPETMRTQLRQAASGKPGYVHLQEQLLSTGFPLRVLLQKAEQVARTTGDAEIAERHLARALADWLNADLGRQAIDGERLVAEVTAMERGPVEERITQALELERLQFAKAQEKMMRAVADASAGAQADFSRRGVGGSGMHLGRIIEVHANAINQMAVQRVVIRKQVAQKVPEIASKSELARLRKEIEAMIDTQWANLPTGVARYCGGPSVENDVRRLLDSGQWADTPMAAKTLAATELGILEREASLGVAAATAPEISAATIDVDAVTGLLPRASFDTDIGPIVAEHQKGRRPLALLVVDIDHFKSVNDEHGHDVGDVVLKGIATRINGVVEGKGRAYKYGGEEIVVVFPNMMVEEALPAAERIRKSVEAARFEPLNRQVTISVGLAALPQHGENAQVLFRAADQAVLSAKRLGRNRVEVAGTGS